MRNVLLMKTTFYLPTPHISFHFSVGISKQINEFCKGLNITFSISSNKKTKINHEIGDAQLTL